MQVGGSGSHLRLGALALLAALAAALLFAATARADSDVGPRVAPGVHIADASSLDGAAAGRSASLAPRIVNGRPINIAEAPWQAALTLNPAIYAGNAFERQFCGGSLVAPRLIISAAHCMVDPRTDTIWADGEIAAVTGRTQLSSSEGQEIPVADIFLFVDGQGNPLFVPPSSGWDVALVVLGQPSTATPIKIPGPDETELWAVGRRADVTGWGATSFEGPGSDALLSAETAVLPDSTCRRPLGVQFDTATSLCVGLYSGKRDSCQGDSGGPLTTLTADGSARLVGDVQSGFECARAFIPGIYGRFGADPLRSALQGAASQLVGADIVGSGGRPPTTLTKNQAIELSFVRADELCQKTQGCRVKINPDKCTTVKACPSINGRQCKPKQGGFKCLVEVFGKEPKKGKVTCVQPVLWTADTGEIERENLGKQSCSKGW